LMCCIPNKHWKYKESAHLFVKLETPLAILHEAARRLGLKRSWFCDSPKSMPHYDLCRSKREQAVDMGIEELDFGETGRIVRTWREFRSRRGEVMIQELIKQGIEASQNETDFRGWAAQWFPGIDHHRPTGTSNGAFEWIQPLEVWAFRAREMAGENWMYGCLAYHIGGPIPPYMPDVMEEETRQAQWWFAEKRKSAEWIIAGCIALEMQKEAR